MSSSDRGQDASYESVVIGDSMLAVVTGNRPLVDAPESAAIQRLGRVRVVLLDGLSFPQEPWLETSEKHSFCALDGGGFPSRSSVESRLGARHSNSSLACLLESAVWVSGLPCPRECTGIRVLPIPLRKVFGIRSQETGGGLLARALLSEFGLSMRFRAAS